MEKYDVVNELGVAGGGAPEDEHSDRHSSSISDNEDFIVKKSLLIRQNKGI